MELFLFMTFSASLLILSALILRPLTGRVLPRSLQMALWIAASLRLLLPVNIHTPLSVLSMLSIPRSAAKPVVIPPPQTVPLPSATPAPLAPAPALPALPESAPVSPAEPAASLSFLELLPWIWLFGTVLTAGVLLILHLWEMRRCREKTRDPQAEQQTPRFVRVFRCRTVAAPFTAGLFRPQILLPEALPPADLPAVLAHECAHIRGLDILKKYLFAAALCVNWFHPLVWIMVWLAARDLEILCDARALRRPDAPDAKTYAHTLLNAEERRTLFTLGFKGNTEVRLMKILKKENHNLFILILSALLVVLLITACATEPPAAEPGPSPEDPQTEVSLEPENPLTALLMENGRFQYDDLLWGISKSEAKTRIDTLEDSEPAADPPAIEKYDIGAARFETTLLDIPVEALLSFYGDRLSHVTFTTDTQTSTEGKALFDAWYTEMEALFGKPTRDTWIGSSDDPIQVGYVWTRGETDLMLARNSLDAQYGVYTDISLCLMNPSVIDPAITAARTEEALQYFHDADRILATLRPAYAFQFKELSFGMSRGQVEHAVGQLEDLEVSSLGMTGGTYRTTLLDYDGTAYLYFNRNALCEVHFDIPFETAEAADAAHDQLLTDLQESFGTYQTNSSTDSYGTQIHSCSWNQENTGLALTRLSGSTELIRFQIQRFYTIDPVMEQDLEQQIENLEAEISRLSERQAQLVAYLQENSPDYAPEGAWIIAEEYTDSEETYLIYQDLLQLKTPGALEEFKDSLPDVSNMETRCIDVRRVDTDEVVASYRVPADDFVQYYEQLRELFLLTDGLYFTFRYA